MRRLVNFVITMHLDILHTSTKIACSYGSKPVSDVSVNKVLLHLKSSIEAFHRVYSQTPAISGTVEPKSNGSLVIDTYSNLTVDL